mgnify:CR=1 FL=1
MQGRGLKPCLVVLRLNEFESPLMQGRGLKHQDRASKQRRICVAPYAGAWIETVLNFSIASAASVAPYAGAWIET